MSVWDAWERYRNEYIDVLMDDVVTDEHGTGDRIRFADEAAANVLLSAFRIAIEHGFRVGLALALLEPKLAEEVKADADQIRQSAETEMSEYFSRRIEFGGWIREYQAGETIKRLATGDPDGEENADSTT